MKILFVASEGLPYSKTGGLADVVQALPKALWEMGHEVAVLLPRYQGNKVSSILISSMSVALGDTMRFPAIAEAQAQNGVRYFFISDPAFFERPCLYGDANGDYPDNAERFTEFSRAVIEFIKRIWLPDVVHCHDWQSALVPVLLRTQHADDPAVRSLPVVLTIHNLGYQGLFPETALRRSGLPESFFSVEALEFYGRVNFLKGGLLFADYLSTVSRRYAREIQTPEYGYGLDGVIQSRADRLIGILNGADYDEWNPQTDKIIAQNYSQHDLAGKAACKKDLLDLFGLPLGNMDRPVIGIVSRFVDQKGFDLIAATADQLLAEDLAIVAVGTGLAEYEALFCKLAENHPERVSVKIGYDNEAAHKVEAGADMFLMPSRYEPCGLSQIYSLRYGTVPIVRATGGLDDTVQSFDPRTKQGTGFKFEEYNGPALLKAVRAAVAVYRERDAWTVLQTNGMAKDFSWKSSAASYVTLYEAAKRSRIPKVARTSKR